MQFPCSDPGTFPVPSYAWLSQIRFSYKRNKKGISHRPGSLIPRRIRHAFLIFYIAESSVSRQLHSVSLPACELIWQELCRQIPFSASRKGTSQAARRQNPQPDDGTHQAESSVSSHTSWSEPSRGSPQTSPQYASGRK